MYFQSDATCINYIKMYKNVANLRDFLFDDATNSVNLSLQSYDPIQTFFGGGSCRPPPA